MAKALLAGDAMEIPLVIVYCTSLLMSAGHSEELQKYIPSPIPPPFFLYSILIYLFIDSIAIFQRPSCSRAAPLPTGILFKTPWRPSSPPRLPMPRHQPSSPQRPHGPRARTAWTIYGTCGLQTILARRTFLIGKLRVRGNARTLRVASRAFSLLGLINWMRYPSSHSLPPLPYPSSYSLFL